MRFKLCLRRVPATSLKMAGPKHRVRSEKCMSVFSMDMGHLMMKKSEKGRLKMFESRMFQIMIS